MQIIWSPLARADLSAIFEFLLSRNPAAAVSTVELIEACAWQLADHPQIGRAGRVDDTRELIVSQTPYIIAYRIRENVVEIASVIHSSRQWPERF